MGAQVFVLTYLQLAALLFASNHFRETLPKRWEAISLYVELCCQQQEESHYGALVSVEVRPVFVVNMFLVTRPHAVYWAACFGHYCHYLALRMLSSMTKINDIILSVVCSGNVQVAQDMLR